MGVGGCPHPMDCTHYCSAGQWEENKEKIGGVDASSPINWCNFWCHGNSHQHIAGAILRIWSKTLWWNLQILPKCQSNPSNTLTSLPVPWEMTSTHCQWCHYVIEEGPSASVSLLLVVSLVLATLTNACRKQMDSHACTNITYVKFYLSDFSSPAYLFL